MRSIEQERNWKETIEVTSWKLPGGNKNKTPKIPARLATVMTEIRTQDLPNTFLNRYCYNGAL
jgi:hypothetical protein